MPRIRVVDTKSHYGKTVDKFLTLLGGRYVVAEKAAYFVETTLHAKCEEALVHLNAVTSHFTSVLSNPDQSNGYRDKEFRDAEEHLRRATIAPYIMALNTLFEKLEGLQCRYIGLVVNLKLKNRSEEIELGDRLTKHEIGIRRQRAVDLIEEGKQLIATGNKAHWEKGAMSFVQAYKGTDELVKCLEAHLKSASSIHRRRLNVKRWITGVGITLVVAACGYIASS